MITEGTDYVICLSLVELSLENLLEFSFEPTVVLKTSRDRLTQSQTREGAYRYIGLIHTQSQAYLQKAVHTFEHHLATPDLVNERRPSPKRINQSQRS